jgi:hypothetical protein
LLYYGHPATVEGFDKGARSKMATNPRDFIAKDLYPAHSVDRGAEDGILMERIALGDEQA